MKLYKFKFGTVRSAGAFVLELGAFDYGRTLTLAERDLGTTL